MDKYIFDESNGLWYELQGDYYIPNNIDIEVIGKSHKGGFEINYK